MSNLRTLVLKRSELEQLAAGARENASRPEESRATEPELDVPIYEGTLILSTSRLAPAKDAGEGGATRVASVDEWLGVRANSIESPRDPVKHAPPRSLTHTSDPEGLVSRVVATAARRSRSIMVWMRSAPTSRRVLLILLPVALFAALGLLPDEAASTEAVALAQPRPAPGGPRSLGSAQHAVEGQAAAPNLASLASASKASGASLNSSKKTLSRAAADALAEGNTSHALLLYRKLALQTPTTPAVAAAVRILERRLAADFQQSQ